MSVRIITGDSLDVLKTLPDCSVHMCCTSPPYWGLRCYGMDGQYGLEPTIGEYVDKMVAVFREVRRVLRDDGTVFLNLGDSYASGAAVSVQQMRSDRSKARQGEGDVRQVLPQDGAREVVGGASLAGAGAVSSVASSPCESAERSDAISASAAAGEGSVGVGREVQVLRGDTASISDARPYTKRRIQGSAIGASSFDEASGSGGVSSGPLSDTLLELQRCEGAFGGVPAYGRLKPKDLCGIPWRVAFALQADGWYLRQDIIWAKPNPMPESVRDRCTKSHEYLFLLAKSERYYYDADAIAEPNANPNAAECAKHWSERPGNGEWPSGTGGRMGSVQNGRNKRSVWTVTTQPFSEAHFATFPPALIEPCILAGTSPQACEKCGAPWERMVERESSGASLGAVNADAGVLRNDLAKHAGRIGDVRSSTTGWQPTCACENTGSALCTVLDPFGGAGTTGLVADRLQRSALLIELNPEYAAMARRRVIGDAPLFAEVA